MEKQKLATLTMQISEYSGRSVLWATWMNCGTAGTACMARHPSVAHAARKSVTRIYLLK